MRSLRALLFVLTVLVGQAHACSGQWRLPNGAACQTCVTETCAFESLTDCQKASASLTANSNTDCHSCCTLKVCENDGKAEMSTISPSIQFEFARIEFVLEIPSLGVIEPRTVHVQIEQGFPNAPPSASSSRAPPFQLS